MSIFATGEGALRVVLFHEERMCCFFRERSCYLHSPRIAHVYLYQPDRVLWHASGKSTCAFDALLHLTSKPPDWKNCCSMCSSPVGVLMMDFFFFLHGKRGKLALVFCCAVQNVAQDHHATPKTAEEPGVVFRLEETSQSCPVLLTLVFSSSTSD